MKPARQRMRVMLLTRLASGGVLGLVLGILDIGASLGQALRRLAQQFAQLLAFLGIQLFEQLFLDLVPDRIERRRGLLAVLGQRHLHQPAVAPAALARHQPLQRKPADRLGHGRRLDPQQGRELTHRHRCTLQGFQRLFLAWKEPERVETLAHPCPVKPRRHQQGTADAFFEGLGHEPALGKGCGYFSPAVQSLAFMTSR
ncbi:conserved hypothetical protein [Bosea sp. EC-HK365B]|nr:conserved hypothetical protein [Bosea sp. 21B]CAD5262747.1 conserved hypothetical protein [Bosea sp. 7B]VVT43781.1 conserved hypothetical protein [Bosea sp. EC-HK365B]VXC36017.1 conserved hypothetical protein [Bosea sp. 127]